MEIFKKQGINWVHTGGSKLKNIDRKTQRDIDSNFSNHSYTGFKWNLDTTHVRHESEEELGYFTARIPIMDHAGTTELMSIYSLDSETFECNTTLPGSSCLSVKTIGWFEEQQDLFSHSNKRRDFIFMHRPL